MKGNSYFILSMCFCIACASSNKLGKEPAMEPVLEVPAGVDSSIAAVSDKLADSSFVTMENENQAEELKKKGEGYIEYSDTLWQYLELTDSTSDSVSNDKKTASLKAYNKGGKALKELMELRDSEELDSLGLIKKQLELLDNAQLAFERAVSLNPFDEEARYRLAQVYQLKASRLMSSENYKKAIVILERLTRINKGQHIFYSNLAQSYFATKSWLKSAEYFKAAQNVLLETSELRSDSTSNASLTSQDSASMFYYLFYEADSHAKLYDSVNSIKTFSLAKSFATNTNDSKAVQSYVDWINWDGGNIQASVARDSVLALDTASDLIRAEDGYVNLLKTLKTQKAKDEIEWRLALVEYRSKKEDDAAIRLHSLIKRTSTNPDGIPLDSTYRRYFDDYGTICYNLAGKYLREIRNRRTALKYYNQAGAIYWAGQAKSFIEIAKLIMNNKKESLTFAKRAEREIGRLDQNDKKELYGLLANLYRRSGDFAEARRYRNLWRGK